MAPDLRKRLLAILAADVVGYSRLMATDDQATVAMLDAARAIFRVRIAANGGRVVDMAGDSVMAVFETTAGAMAAALGIQRELGAAVSGIPADLRMQFRIGIHVGDVIEKADGTVYGEGVNIAARLEGLADPGAIAISQAVHGMVSRWSEATFEDLGEQSVKNIPEPVRAFRVRQPVAGGLGHRRTTLTPHRTLRTGNLPESASVLFGRDVDLRALTSLVRERQLVTVVGAGGIGKTRLAVAAAQTVCDAFPDGTFLVELAPLTDATLLPGAVAQALGIALAGRKPAQAELFDSLRERATLIVLDNCEHVVAAVAGFVAGLLDCSPESHILATSQVSLKAAGEHLYRLETLGLPLTTELPAAGSFGSVRLFVERVRPMRPDFALTAGNVEDVVAICRALDGLPLAIELAAARVQLLGVSGVREHLNERFRLLTRGSRVAERRHRTLLEALNWSHGLLEEDERAVFRRIGVFSGGFTLGAAQDISASDGIDEWTVLDRLGALADKSLVVVGDAEPRRYQLLESAREYALEKLSESGEENDVRDRHAAFFLGEAEAAEPMLTSAERQIPLKKLRSDLSNFRSALSWLIRGRADARGALRLAASLTWLAYFDSLYQEGLTWLSGALAIAGAEAFPVERAAALSGAARLAAYSGAATQAQALAKESVELWRGVGDVRGLAYALFHHGIACIVAGKSDLGRVFLAEALASFRKLDDAWGIALGASYLGTAFALVPGEENEARRLLLEGRARFQALGDDWGSSVSSHYLGSIALRLKDYETARDLTHEMLVNARALGDRYRISRNLHQLAEIDLAEGRYHSAASHLLESVTISCQQGRLGDASQQFRLFARLAILLGDSERAAKLAGAASRHAATDRTMPADDPNIYASQLAQVREALGEDRFQRNFGQGALLSADECITLAATLAVDSG